MGISRKNSYTNRDSGFHNANYESLVSQRLITERIGKVLRQFDDEIRSNRNDLANHK